jgi:hypothetical protein
MLFHLAQINIAKFRVPADDPVNAGFINNLDRVNAIAEQQPGFIWRMTGEGNNALDLQAFDDPNIAANMSVWTDLNALAAWVYRNMDHREIMRRRREWFDAMEIFMALWWVPAGHIPTLEEGKRALETLAALGPTQAAFTFRYPFPPPGAEEIAPILDKCA